MVLTLLAVTFVISFIVSWIVARIFQKPIEGILARIIKDEISKAWLRYLQFAVYVVGISSGVRVHRIEDYLLPRAIGPNTEPRILVLNGERWVLEVYRTVIGTLQGVAWMLLVFFLVALIAYVIVRVFEGKKSEAGTSPE